MNAQFLLVAVAVAAVFACGTTTGQGSPGNGQSSAGSGTPPAAVDYNAPTNLDACTLLTATDAATILGGNVTARSTTRISCSYGDDTGHFVGVELAGASLFGPGRQALKATNQQVEDVGGLGDAAYYSVSSGEATLYVKKSGAQLTIKTGVSGGNQTVGQQEASEKQVAQLALSRMRP